MSLYLIIIVILSLLALAIAAPLTISGARGLATFFAIMLNLEVQDFQVPPSVLAVQGAVGLLVPFAATLYALRTGLRITVREAISDYGLGQESLGAGRFDRLLERIRHLPQTFLLAWRNLFRRREMLSRKGTARIMRWLRRKDRARKTERPKRILG